MNDIAHFESDVMPSKGGSIISDGGLVPYEVVILTGGFNIYIYDQRAALCLQRWQGGVCLSSKDSGRLLFQEHGICFGGGVIQLFVRHGTFERAA